MENEILREATRLLGNYKPKEALLKLSELKEESERSSQLKEKCKGLLKQQSLYLLKELKTSKDYIGMKGIVYDYKKYIGEDKDIKPYINLIDNYNEEVQNNIDNNANIVVFALIGIAILIVLIFI